MRPGRLLTVLIATLTLLLPSTAAWAHVGAPTDVFNYEVTRNANGSHTLVADGTWSWDRDCGGTRTVGWEMDWDDRHQPGNVVGAPPTGGEIVDVGVRGGNSRNATDNRVDYKTDNCHEDPNINDYSTGTWGPLTHTYPADIEHVSICVVIYDLRNEKIASGEAGRGSLVAGGHDHNEDNSVEEDEPGACNRVQITLRTTTECSDGINNDAPEDNLIDAADPGCHTDGDPANPNSYDPNDDDESFSAPECSDGVDNDDPEDSLVDRADPGCHSDADPNDGDDTYRPNNSERNTQCSDGRDNTDPEDVLADAADPGCHTDGNPNNPASYDPSDPSEANKVECNDGVDNADPEDTLADQADPGCHSDGDPNDNDSSYTPYKDDETNAARPQCSDGRDNADPEDTLVDAADPGCHTDGDPNDGDNTYDPNDNDETNTVPQCSDGVDNADPEDTLIDRADPGCHTDGDPNDGDNTYDPNDNDETNTVPQCSDGVDNADPEDTLIDAADPGCHTDGNANNPNSYNPQDNDESNARPQCSDGIDNDDPEDALADAADPHCDGPDDPSERPSCSDGVDNTGAKDEDGDTLIDAADPGCHSDGNPNNAASYTPGRDNETDPTDLADCTTGSVDEVVAPPNETTRLAGETRFETAIAASQLFCDSTTVVLARSDDFPDAQAGTPLALRRNAPLLLTNPSSLHPATRTEINRLMGGNGTVILLGGEVAIAPAVADELIGLGYDIIRYGGANRFETAAIIADRGLGNPSTILLADGGTFADAVVAGAAAAQVSGTEGLIDGAVLLTSGSTMAPETASYLDGRTGERVYTVGAAADDAYTGATAGQLVGSGLYGTSVAVADTLWPDGPATIAIARADDFPDALAGGSIVGKDEIGPGPMLLTNSSALPSVVANYIRDNADSIDRVIILGGTVAVNANVQSEIDTILDR